MILYDINGLFTEASVTTETSVSYDLLILKLGRTVLDT